MQKWLQIENEGEIADGALTLLGASTKEGVEGKIGFFGSGAKYAMSTLLREGIGLRIFSGDREVVVSVRDVSFGGQTFQQILLDGRDTSFTTRMGPTWEVWFACREFVCNAIDEGGDSVAEVDCCSGHAGVTRIFIDSSDSRVSGFIEHLDDYILQRDAVETVVTPFGRVAILEQPDDERCCVLYRRRVRIVPTDFRDLSLFRYNFDNIAINESRIYQYSYEYLERIAAALAMSSSAHIVKRFLDSFASTDYYIEHDAKWEYINSDIFSDIWPTVLGTKRIYTVELAKLVGHEDTLGQWILPRSLVECLSSRFPQLNIVGRDSDNFLARTHKTLSKRIARSLKRLSVFGYDNVNFVEVEVGSFTDTSCMARYLRKSNKIQVSIDRYVKASDSDIDKMMLEELKYADGFRDNSREFEQWLLHELLSAKSLSAREHAILAKVAAATKEATALK